MWIKYQWLATLSTLVPLLACTQPDMRDYAGSWTGSFPDPKIFDFEVHLKWEPDMAAVSMINGDWKLEKTLPVNDKQQISGELADGIKVEGELREDGTFSGFVQTGILQYHLHLQGQAGKLSGSWHPLMIVSLDNPLLYLSVERASGEQYEAYPFFGDNRFTGTWCGNFSKEKDRIWFTDMKTGLEFSGKLAENRIHLELGWAGQVLETVSLERTDDEWSIGVTGATPLEDWTRPRPLPDGWEVADENYFDVDRLEQLSDGIQEGQLTFPHSILVARAGKLALEAYFGGYQMAIPHDQRSASKSVASALIGVAVDRGLMTGEDQKLYDFLPDSWAYTRRGDERKTDITLKDLLTMSSGLDAIDFGIDRNSSASEGSYQQSSDWLKTVLEAPMINEPGKVAYYGSANPYLLGVALHKVLPESMNSWIDRRLLAPLGITDYIIQNDDTGQPYFGGGMYLRPRDMLKFGQLYLDRGLWKGQRILSESWVERSQQNYLTLDNTNDRNGYGYLWWHKTYRIGEREVHSVEARGAGGQYIMVIPELELVVVMTSGNFRNGRFMQPELILEQYLLPALLMK